MTPYLLFTKQPEVRNRERSETQRNDCVRATLSPPSSPPTISTPSSRPFSPFRPSFSVNNTEGTESCGEVRNSCRVSLLPDHTTVQHDYPRHGRHARRCHSGGSPVCSFRRSVRPAVGRWKQGLGVGWSTYPGPSEGGWITAIECGNCPTGSGWHW